MPGLPSVWGGKRIVPSSGPSDPHSVGANPYVAVPPSVLFRKVAPRQETDRRGHLNVSLSLWLAIAEPERRSKVRQPERRSFLIVHNHLSGVQSRTYRIVPILGKGPYQKDSYLTPHTVWSLQNLGLNASELNPDLCEKGLLPRNWRVGDKDGVHDEVLVSLDFISYMPDVWLNKGGETADTCGALEDGSSSQRAREGQQNIKLDSQRWVEEELTGMCVSDWIKVLMVQHVLKVSAKRCRDLDAKLPTQTMAEYREQRKRQAKLGAKQGHSEKRGHPESANWNANGIYTDQLTDYYAGINVWESDEHAPLKPSAPAPKKAFTEASNRGSPKGVYNPKETRDTSDWMNKVPGSVNKPIDKQKREHLFREHLFRKSKGLD